MIHIIGGGLAGSEAAWQAASEGVPVTLYEMRPGRPTAVHKSDRLAELVCSNSFRGDKLDNAVGLLKAEMRRLGSLVMRAAEASRVPAGAALAVDRARFAETVTRALGEHPLVTVVRQEVVAIPSSTERDPVIVATGPLTSDALSADIARLVGREHLSFYDAISPIVSAESIDQGRVAGTVGIIAVVLIMMAYYRVAGVLAVGALGVYLGGFFFDLNGTYLWVFLATALATPCTAPALATALGFAFTQPPWIIALMFATVGLGLAAARRPGRSAHGRRGGSRGCGRDGRSSSIAPRR